MFTFSFPKILLFSCFYNSKNLIIDKYPQFTFFNIIYETYMINLSENNNFFLYNSHFNYLNSLCSRSVIYLIFSKTNIILNSFIFFKFCY